jgi:hypothetical protein
LLKSLVKLWLFYTFMKIFVRYLIFASVGACPNDKTKVTRVRRLYDIANILQVAYLAKHPLEPSSSLRYLPEFSIHFIAKVALA